MSISWCLVAVLAVVVTSNPVVGVDVDYSEYGLCSKLPGNRVMIITSKIQPVTENLVIMLWRLMIWS